MMEKPMTAQPFWDRIAPKYARKPVDDPGAYQQKLRLVASLLRPQDSVLEIGCGTGTTALHLARHVTRYTATDGARAMIGIAEAKLGPDAPANVTFHHADAADRMPGAPFDAICAFSLLHLVDDVPRVLEAVHAQLHPGGLFVSKTVCLKDAARAIRLLVPVLAGLRLAPRVTPLGRADLVRHIEDAGFTVAQVTHFDPRRMSPVIVARKTA
jgi:ubiquinone/menaquinone biosynthesis C-methylase UbiE